MINKITINVVSAYIKFETKQKLYTFDLALLRKYFLSEFLSIHLGEKNQEMVDLEIIQPCIDA